MFSYLCSLLPLHTQNIKPQTRKRRYATKGLPSVVRIGAFYVSAEVRGSLTTGGFLCPPPKGCFILRVHFLTADQSPTLPSSAGPFGTLHKPRVAARR